MLKKVLISIFVFPIRVYQYVISPLFPANCRFSPTCSQYTIEAIKTWGIIKGISLGSKRIAKCHPKGPSGYDPIPKKQEDESQT